MSSVSLCTFILQCTRIFMQYSALMYPFQVLPATIVSSESAEFRREDVRLMELAGEVVSPGDEDSGISLQIPSWKGLPMVSRHLMS